MAIVRTESKPIDVNSISLEILNEFKGVDVDDMVKAIRNGSLGKYGRTYRLSTQEICIWIREYLKKKNNPMGV